MISNCFQLQSAHPFGYRILEKLTFRILSDLSLAGLPKVHNRLASQVLRFDLGTVYDFCHCFPLRMKNRHYNAGHETDEFDACRWVQ